MKPISKYRRKTMCRTLLGQKLAEALKDENPSAANTEVLKCVSPRPRKHYCEKAYTLNA
jgi:hypothetical protein